MNQSAKPVRNKARDTSFVKAKAAKLTQFCPKSGETRKIEVKFATNRVHLLHCGKKKGGKAMHSRPLSSMILYQFMRSMTQPGVMFAARHWRLCRKFIGFGPRDGGDLSRKGNFQHLVDMADGARRTMITGASNTVMGVVLLVMGAVSSLIAIIGPEAVLLFLAVVGVVGVVGAGRLKDVSHRGS